MKSPGPTTPDPVAVDETKNVEPVWSLPLALSFFVLWVALSIVIQVASVALATLIHIVSLPDAPKFDDQTALQTAVEQAVKTLQDSPFIAVGMLACTVLTWMVTFGVLEMFFRSVSRPVLFRAFGLKAPLQRASMLWAVPIGLVAFGMAEALSVILQSDTDANPFEKLMSEVPGQIAIVVMAVVVAPIAEEVFFRGFLFPPMRRAMPVTTAILLNAVVFAMAHLMTYGWDAASLAPILLLGIAVASLRSWSGSVIPGIIAHFVFNGTSLLIYFLSKYLPGV